MTDGSNPSLQASRSPERPNRVGDGSVDNPTIERWLDRAAFVSAPRGSFGNSGVGIVRAPGFYNIDMSLSKRFLTFGRQFLMIRGEMFNVLNHPNFGAPQANIQSTAFGTITSTVGDAQDRDAGRQVHLLIEGPVPVTSFQFPAKTGTKLATGDWQLETGDWRRSVVRAAGQPL